MSDPVRVVFGPELSHALRYLHQRIQPTPTLTGMVSQAVREWIEQRAERESEYHAPFRDLQRLRRSHLKRLK